MGGRGIRALICTNKPPHLQFVVTDLRFSFVLSTAVVNLAVSCRVPLIFRFTQNLGLVGLV
jgi:hypothetical protein